MTHHTIGDWGLRTKLAQIFNIGRNRGGAFWVHSIAPKGIELVAITALERPYFVISASMSTCKTETNSQANGMLLRDIKTLGGCAYQLIAAGLIRGNEENGSPCFCSAFLVPLIGQTTTANEIRQFQSNLFQLKTKYGAQLAAFALPEAFDYSDWQPHEDGYQAGGQYIFRDGHQELVPTMSPIDFIDLYFTRADLIPHDSDTRWLLVGTSQPYGWISSMGADALGFKFAPLDFLR